jgi:hypothetical protein
MLIGRFVRIAVPRASHVARFVAPLAQISRKRMSISAACLISPRADFRQKVAVPKGAARFARNQTPTL